MKTIIKLGLIATFILLLPLTPRCFTSGHLAYDPYYVRPTKPKDTRIKVQIVVRDDLTGDTVDYVESVTFDGRKLSLSPKDFLGNRGSFYFKTPAGNHRIVWTLHRESGWPSSQTFSKEVNITPQTSLFYAEIYKDKIQVDAIQ